MLIRRINNNKKKITLKFNNNNLHHHVSVLMFLSVCAPSLFSVSHGANKLIHIHICLSGILVQCIKILPQMENFCLITLESQLFNWNFWETRQENFCKGLQSDVPDFHGDRHFNAFKDWIYGLENCSYWHEMDEAQN